MQTWEILKRDIPGLPSCFFCCCRAFSAIWQKTHGVYNSWHGASASSLSSCCWRLMIGIRATQKSNGWYFPGGSCTFFLFFLFFKIGRSRNGFLHVLHFCHSFLYLYWWYPLKSNRHLFFQCSFLCCWLGWHPSFSKSWEPRYCLFWEAVFAFTFLVGHCHLSYSKRWKAFCQG